MQKTCKQFIVFDAGLVVNPSFPCLGASPDGKVYDPTKKDPFGLLEIKKNLTHREITQWRKPARIQTSAFIWLMESQNLKKVILHTQVTVIFPVISDRILLITRL